MKLNQAGTSGILLLLLMMMLPGNADDYGEVTLQIDEASAQPFIIRTARLYRSVTLEYDTTLQVTADSLDEFYYYPQIFLGSEYVLHLILDVKSGIINRENVESYDLYFVLGDSLMPSLSFEGADSTAYFFAGGAFVHKKWFSRNMSGLFQLQEETTTAAVEGSFQATFDFPDPQIAEKYRRIQISGSLNVPAENFLAGEEGSLSRSRPQSQKNLQRNIYLSILTVALIVAFTL